MATPQMVPVAKMQTIVLGTDGSEYSEGAVREAIQWSRQHHSLLYAICTAQVTLGQRQYAAEVITDIDKAARQACDSVKSRAQAEGVTCEFIIHEGEEPYEHIVGEAERVNADSIVIGRRGRRGLMKLLMGSVTHLVIGHAPCPVFVVPRAGKLTGRHILIASDGSETSEKAAMQAISLAKLTKGSIIVCSVVHGGTDKESAQENVSRIQKIANIEKINTETVVCYGNAYEEIINAAKSHDADMIVVGTHGRTGISKLLMGSVAERVVGLSDRTIMVVR